LKSGLENSLSQSRDAGGCNIIMADALSFGSPAFRLSYGRGYELAARQMRWLVKSIYSLTDKAGAESRLVDCIEAGTAQKISPLLTLINENQVNLVCCTHFLPMAMLARRRRKGDFKGALHVCVTDYQVHGFWADSEVDRYYVAGSEAARRLADFGVDPARVQVTGIPARPEFGRSGARPGRHNGRLKILFSASSLKKAECLGVLKEIEAGGCPAEITVVAGRGHNLTKMLESLDIAPRIEIILKGYVADMEKLMGASDLLITKPGGVICTEALCAGLPMLLVAPIPKHEIFNAQIMAGRGAGLICFDRGGIKKALSELDKNRDRLELMSRACQSYARPGASADISRRLLAAAAEGADGAL
jgi:processive 1,2-diacylglycerol beta-glucosyltransferase